MTPPPHHRKVRFRGFTAFDDLALEFVPGVNVLVGENGLGKTHLMKALYAWQLAAARGAWDAPGALLDGVFQVASASELVRLGGATAAVEGDFGGHPWSVSLGGGPASVSFHQPAPRPSIVRPVFIPAIDMMGHSRGFTEAFAELRLDFDLPCADVVNLLRLQRRNGSEPVAGLRSLEAALGGEIESDDEGRFYLATPEGRLAMPLVAEGLRKLATLAKLIDNGWLSPGATLFWDEPEVNLNPTLMDDVVAALLGLSRSGVQVFIATHSYTILREIDVQTSRSDSRRFFALERVGGSIRARPCSHYLDIEPNPMERHTADVCAMAF